MTPKSFGLLGAGLLTLAVISPLAFAHGDEDKPHQEQTLDLTGFSKIDIGGVYDMDVAVGKDYAIALSGHAKEMDNLDIYVRGDTLYLATKKKPWRKGGNQNGVQAQISLPALSAISVGGVAELDVTGIDAPHFEIDAEGVADVTLSGKCGHIEATISGVGEVDARDLKCDRAEATVNGVGELSVFAAQRAEAQVNGMGEINIYGKPENVETKKGWFSNVTVH